MEPESSLSKQTDRPKLKKTRMQNCVGFERETSWFGGCQVVVVVPCIVYQIQLLY
jgi:hypothetical protein